MFKKNCCPGCGAITGWLAGETCSPRCKREVLARVRSDLPSREHIIRMIDEIDTEAQAYAVKSNEHAILLTYATDLRVFKQKISKLPYDKLPEDQMKEWLRFAARYDVAKTELDARVAKKTKPTDDVVTDDEWLQMRPLTDFEREARKTKIVHYDPSTVRLFRDGEEMKMLTLGVDVGADDAFTAVIVAKTKDGKSHVLSAEQYKATFPLKPSDLDEEPSRVAAVFAREMVECAQRKQDAVFAREHQGRIMSPANDLIIHKGIREILDTHNLQYCIERRHDRIHVSFKLPDQSEAEITIDLEQEPLVLLKRVKESVVETLLQARAPHTPPTSVTLDNGYSKRTHKVQGKYDAASGMHLDRLAKLLDLVREPGINGKHEDDASLRIRMYACEVARGGGTHKPMTGQPAVSKTEREAYRSGRMGSDRSWGQF